MIIITIIIKSHRCWNLYVSLQWSKNVNLHSDSTGRFGWVPFKVEITKIGIRNGVPIGPASAVFGWLRAHENWLTKIGWSNSDRVGFQQGMNGCNWSNKPKLDSQILIELDFNKKWMAEIGWINRNWTWISQIWTISSPWKLTHQNWTTKFWSSWISARDEWLKLVQ